MFDEHTPAGRPPRRVLCPECGDEFVARGLAAHRRMRHGQSTRRATASATPAQSESSARVDLAQGIASIAAILERIDARIERLETFATTVSKAASSPRELVRPLAQDALRAELGTVLAEIAATKTRAAKRTSQLGERAQSDDQRDVERASNKRLGLLRKRQASLLFRLNELAIDAVAGESGDALCLF